MPGYIYRVQVLINLYLWYIPNKELEFHVYDMLHTDAKYYIIMCKLVKLAFCLCCEPIDPSNMGFHKSTLVARGANTQLDPSCVYQRSSD